MAFATQVVKKSDFQPDTMTESSTTTERVKVRRGLRFLYFNEVSAVSTQQNRSAPATKGMIFTLCVLLW